MPKSPSPPEDGDSLMQDTSTPDLSDDDEPILTSSSTAPIHAPSTPTHDLHQATATSDLSPPDSHGAPSLPPGANTKYQQQQQQPSFNSTTMPPAELLNANGKRTLDAATGNASVASTAGAASGKYLGRHEGGYAWYREEDAPGYAWRNNKAREEEQRALSQIVDLGSMVKGRYGDVLMERGFLEQQR